MEDLAKWKKKPSTYESISPFTLKILIYGSHIQGLIASRQIPNETALASMDLSESQQLT